MKLEIGLAVALECQLAATHPRRSVEVGDREDVPSLHPRKGRAPQFRILVGNWA